MTLEITIKVPLTGEVSISQSATREDAEITSLSSAVPGSEPPPALLDDGTFASEPADVAAPPPLVDLEDGDWPTVEAGPQPPSVESLEIWSAGGPPGFGDTPPAPEDLGFDASSDTADMEPPALEELMAVIEEAADNEKAPKKSTRTRKTTSD